MKSLESMLVRWDGILAKKGSQSALFDRTGACLRTFAAIEEQARAFASELDLPDAGEIIAIQIGNHPDWPALLLACWRRGLVVLPLEATMNDDQLHAALEICRARALVTAVVVAAVPGGRDLNVLPLRTPKGFASNAAASTAKADWGDAVPVLLKLTSGTTAAPRAIRFRTEQLVADCDNICETMGITETDLNFGVIPVSHSYGFSNLLTPLLARGVPMVVSRERLPRAVIDDLARTGATVFPGMPVFYQAFCEMPEVPRLPGLRLCISAGAPLPASLALKFREKFQQPIHSFYGSSECGGICYDREGANSIDGFVGTPMQGVEIERNKPEEEMSSICVRSAAVGDGYFPEPDVEKLGDGVFFPDDLLAKEPAGYRIAGRISDLINVAGKKVNPAEVEAQLLACEGVQQAIVFGRQSGRRNQEVAACVVAEARITEPEILKFCRTRLSGWQVPKRIFLVDSIPANERGKTSRRELAVLFGPAQ